MPIKIADQLPAKVTLEGENIFVITEYRALHQDIRPLKLVILNLMPIKTETETQLLRCLSNTPLQIEIEFLHTTSYNSKNTSNAHLMTFYTNFEKIANNHYDGMIITGAPVETMEFEDVAYWSELCKIMEWSRRNVHSTLHICWASQAALYYHYGIRKHPTQKKVFGIFDHYVVDKWHPLFRGFDDTFKAPHSRHTEVRADDISQAYNLKLLAESDEAGVHVLANESYRQIFVTGHFEYDANTLENEYRRDISRGLDIEMPRHYFPDDDPSRTPEVTWRSHAQLFFTNWLNYYVYQTTPYNLRDI